VAIEPDFDSFEQANQNIKSSKWADRIQVKNIDLQNYNCSDLKFDLIVSNPPYFVDSLKNPDRRKAVSRHNDTLTNQDLLVCASGLLSDTGKLQVIMPYAEGNIFIAEAAADGLYCNNILKIRPLPTSEIRRLIITFSNQRTKTSESFLTIEHGKRHEFTEEYKKLTRDFYLKF
jgi:tRNA1Val (adenine37-N6)-methyltransferase